MPKPVKAYNDFKELFEAAITYGLIEKPKNEFAKSVSESLHTVRFNNWIQEKKDWKYGDTEHYKKLLTKNNFIKCIKAENEKQSKKQGNAKAEFEKEKESWQINPFAKHNAEKLSELNEKNKQAEIDRRKCAETYIDPNFSYTRTLEDFKEKAEIERRNLDENVYLRFLRNCKEVYGNSAFYHIQWTNSNIGDEHAAIKKFASEEINKLLQKSNELTASIQTEQMAVNTEKLLIAHKIWGENRITYTSPIFHHIPHIIEEYNLDSKEAINILLDLQGSFSPEQRQYIREHIIPYLRERDFKKETLVTPVTENDTQITIKPTFKTEAIEPLYNILKGYFQPNEQRELKQILLTGNDTKKPLLFMSNGNRLADVFKKLIEHEFITVCHKQDLQKWITKNFVFKHLKQKKAFTPDYIEKCISRNYYPCKKPLFEIEKGEIVKAN
jgi:hypothetical protein